MSYQKMRSEEEREEIRQAMGEIIERPRVAAYMAKVLCGHEVHADFEQYLQERAAGMEAPEEAAPAAPGTVIKPGLYATRKEENR